MSVNNFFQELKRRKVYRVAITYAVVVWLLVQIASTILPIYDTPLWVLKTIHLVLFMGFPVALVLAWAFEISPNGIVRTTNVTAESNDHSPYKKNSLMSNLFVAFLLIVIAGQFVYNKYNKDRSNITKIEKSIAVLPFTNESSSIENLYFCNGVLDGVLDHLAKISELKVISRTSVEQYRENRPSLKVIAENLGVNFLVEGSVQRIGNKAVIYAQLINARNDKHMWSQRYNRELSDIFAIQAEIAQSIASNLHTIISPEVVDRIKQRPTENIEAYRLLLEAQYNLNLSGFENIRNAVPLLEKAIDLDPNFAQAYAELARTYILNMTHVDATLEWDTKAYISFQEALRLNPNLAEAYVARGLWNWTPNNNFRHEEAIKDFKKAITLKPGLSTAYESLLLVQFHVGLLDDAIKTGLHGMELEPTSMWMRHFLGQSYFFKGDYEQALRMYESVNEEFLTPFRIALTAQTLNYQGKTKEAVTMIEDGLKRFATDPQLNSTYAILLASSGRNEEAVKSMETAIAYKETLRHVHHLYHNLACASAIMNEKEKAVKWLQETINKGFPCYPLFINDPNLKNLRGFEPFEELMVELKVKMSLFRSL
jgi:TolB-like protein/Tfp pilus assembly protein PilF